jgi:hypothetical protein
MAMFDESLYGNHKFLCFVEKNGFLSLRPNNRGQSHRGSSLPPSPSVGLAALRE